MSVEEIRPTETLTSDFSYHYYADFGRWDGAQIALSGLGAGAGMAAGFAVSMEVHAPYSNYEWKLNDLIAARDNQISPKLIKKDDQEITHLISHQPKTFMHKPEVAAFTLGGGAIFGVLSAVGVVKVRRWLHKRHEQRVEAVSDKLRETFDFVEQFEERFKASN